MCDDFSRIFDSILLKTPIETGDLAFSCKNTPATVAQQQINKLNCSHRHLQFFPITIAVMLAQRKKVTRENR